MTKADIDQHDPWSRPIVLGSAAGTGAITGCGVALVVYFHVSEKLPNNMTSALSSMSPRVVILIGIPVVVLALLTSVASASESSGAPSTGMGPHTASERHYQRWLSETAQVRSFRQIRQAVRVFTLAASYGYLIGATITLAETGATIVLFATSGLLLLLGLLGVAMHWGKCRVLSKATVQKEAEASAAPPR